MEPDEAFDRVKAKNPDRVYLIELVEDNVGFYEIARRFEVSTTCARDHIAKVRKMVKKEIEDSPY
jgi:predicted DNA-binding protein YlxM (UPF0122 family)